MCVVFIVLKKTKTKFVAWPQKKSNTNTIITKCGHKAINKFVTFSSSLILLQ